MKNSIDLFVKIMGWISVIIWLLGTVVTINAICLDENVLNVNSVADMWLSTIVTGIVHVITHIGLKVYVNYCKKEEGLFDEDED